MTIEELSKEYYEQYELLEQNVQAWIRERRESPMADQTRLNQKIAMAKQMARECLDTSCALLRYHTDTPN